MANDNKNKKNNLDESLGNGQSGNGSDFAEKDRKIPYFEQEKEHQKFHEQQEDDYNIARAAVIKETEDRKKNRA